MWSIFSLLSLWFEEWWYQGTIAFHLKVIAKKLEDGKWYRQGIDIDKGCSMWMWTWEAINTFEASWGFSLEPRQQLVLSARYDQINYIKCKHFILWSGPECVQEWTQQGEDDEYNESRQALNKPASVIWLRLEQQTESTDLNINKNQFYYSLWIFSIICRWNK